MALTSKYTRHDMHVIIHPNINTISTRLVEEARVAFVWWSWLM